MVVQSLSQFFDLPLRDFYPASLPAPPVSMIPIDGKGKSHQQIIYEAVVQTYVIMEDHTRLQFSPGSFEQQRGSYPIRREFGAYTLKFSNVEKGIISILEKFGFRIEK